MHSFTRVAVKACGKVNLSLAITGRAPDGYHFLESVMQSIDLCDVLLIGKRGDSALRVTCSDPKIPEDSENIAFKAAKNFFAATGIAEQGFSIHIDKSIPSEAGLAGGSADAAAVLYGLNRLFKAGLSPEQLREIGFQTGADVPFCLTGGLMLTEGKGEILTPLKSLPDCFIVVAKPPLGINTRHAFKLFDGLQNNPQKPDTQAMLGGITRGSLSEIGRGMVSSFSQIGEKDMTEILSGIMLRAGAQGAVLSGSGSAVIGLFKSAEEAEGSLPLLREQVQYARICRPTDFGVQLIYEG